MIERISCMRWSILLFTMAALSNGRTSPAVAADNGDGTYSNPPLFADFPDPDIIRVGDDFYMASTTFVNSPGLAVLHSKDLVNWTTIGNVIDRLAGHPGYDMAGGPLYRNGVFAPSLRYHDGTFYVAVQPNGTGQGLQIYHTQDPSGDWQLNQLIGGAFDPALSFDDDDTPYVVYSGGWHPEIYLRQLTPDLNGFVAPAQEIHNYDGLEGTHVVKRGDYYYMFHSRPGQLAMYVSRSTSLFGGWETIRSIDDASGSGHQGAVVDLPGGDWYGFAMLDSGPIGRVTNISPIAWENDWPVWGADNVIPGEAAKPILGQPLVMQPTSNEFNTAQMLPDWRWNHNPDDARWSLTERPGHLRLRPTQAPDFWNARNTLTYKGFGPQSQLVVELDISNLQPGDHAGLGMLGKGLATLAVNRIVDGDARLILSTGVATADSGPMTMQASAGVGSVDSVLLELRMDFETNQGQAGYSVDGVAWASLGDPFPLLWDWATGTFQGEQYAIFNYSPDASSGYVDVERATFVQRSDFDRDGDVDVDDFQRLYTYHFASLPGSTPLETFGYGDWDGDLDNDYDDFWQFQSDYVALHGREAYQAAAASVLAAPEPCAWALALLGSAIAAWPMRSRRQTSFSRASTRPIGA
ncbi:MAG: glycosyl hydrolase [Planctomycetaceae bacterium]|nr:glycosyl hydrolase [Planctomycetaceae bacterium]